MNHIHKYAWLVCAIVVAIGGFTLVLSNDTAASRAIGGIQLRREANISMEKERLTISEAKVTVEYEFLNQTEKDITTVVAFPIPPYDYGFIDAGAPRDFNDFRLWVEGKEVKYSTEIRAMSGSTDYTDLLKRLGIDIVSFGHCKIESGGAAKGEIAHLPQKQLDQLFQSELIWDPKPDTIPKWVNKKTYFWTQVFPARKVLHVRHDYRPSVGFKTLDFEVAKAHESDFKNAVDNSCIDQPSEVALTQQLNEKYKPGDTALLGTLWIDYILTTANSWKTPIKDFTLIIDARADSQTINAPTLENISLCWDGPIRKLDSNHLIAQKTNFIPKRELRVAFFSFFDDPLK